MKLDGKIVQVFDRRSGVSQSTGNAWASQEFLLETHEEHPKKMLFEVFGQELLDRLSIQPGLEYTVFFNVNAREWNGKWYNSIRAYDARLIANVPPIPVTVHNEDGSTSVQNMPFPGDNSSLGF